MTRTYKVIDADGHILEPIDLWDRYMDPAYREGAPRLVIGDNGKERLLVEGQILGNPKGLGRLGAVVLSSGRADEGTVTASMIPTTQLFAVALGSALSGIIANQAGLAADVSPATAALAGAWLYGSFTVVPLTAVAIAWRLRPARPRRP